MTHVVTSCGAVVELGQWAVVMNVCNKVTSLTDSHLKDELGGALLAVQTLDAHVALQHVRHTLQPLHDIMCVLQAVCDCWEREHDRHRGHSSVALQTNPKVERLGGGFPDPKGVWV